MEGYIYVLNRGGRIYLLYTDMLVLSRGYKK